MWTRVISPSRPLCHALVAGLVAVGWACDSQPITAPISPSSIPAPTPVPGPQRYHVSGIVMDAEGGAPIANGMVMLRFNQGELTTRTDGNGSYTFSFDASGPYRPQFGAIPGNALGLLITSDGTRRGANWPEHWTAVQLLPWDATAILHNVRLRPVRTLAAGQSMALSIQPDSSLTWDKEWDPWTFVSYDALWEEFLVSVHADGALTINVRSDGATVATLGCQYVGCPSFRVHGPVSFPVRAGATLYFSIEIPRARAPQLFEVQTSLQ